MLSIFSFPTDLGNLSMVNIFAKGFKCDKNKTRRSLGRYNLIEVLLNLININYTYANKYIDL